MSAHFSKCALCAAEFRADPSQEAAYRASLGAGDKAETERLLRAINAHWALTHHMAEAHQDALFHCPRGPAPGGRFQPGFDGTAYWQADRTCSYCGSLHPQDFLDAAAAGAEITPTDKSYKAYIDLPQEDPDRLRVVSSTWSTTRPGDTWQEATPELCEKHNWQPWGSAHQPGDLMWVQLMPQGPVRNAKFYFQHLDQAGQDRFIALHNEQKMKLAFPGHFYARPFFCEPAKAAS